MILNKEFFLFDEITTTTARNLAELLAAPTTKSVTIRLNSPGGDATSGIAMSNAIRSFKGKVAITVEGLCASAATMLVCVAPTTAACNAMFMIHNCWIEVKGNAKTIREYATALDKVSDEIINLYVKKTHRSFDSIKSLLESGDCWLTAKEAFDFGLIDAVGPELKVQANAGRLILPPQKTAPESHAAAVWRNTPQLHSTYPTVEAFIKQCKSTRPNL